MYELKLRHVTKKYGDKLALDDFSFTFREGIYGILGANGAGKSTLMNLITDNLKRDGGNIFEEERSGIWANITGRCWAICRSSRECMRA